MMMKFRLTFQSSSGDQFTETITGEYGNALAYIQGYMAGTGMTLVLMEMMEADE